MEQCGYCKVSKHEEDFEMYHHHKLVGGKEYTSYTCKDCSERHYGDRWFAIEGYDEICDISSKGTVRELREGRYYNISRIRNAGVQYVYLHKNGKQMKKNINSLLKRFVYKQISREEVQLKLKKECGILDE